MPKLGLSTGISRSGIVTPGIVTDNLVMKHMYPSGAILPLSDGAAYFDGSNSYVDMGSSTDIAFTTGYGSVGGWFLIGSEANSQCIMSRGVGLTSGGNISSGVCGWSISYYDGSDKIYFDTFYDDGDGTTTRRNINSATDSIEPGRWYHVMATRAQSGSDTLHTLYLDGASVGTLTVSSGAGNNLNDDDHPFRIGVDKASGLDMTGYVCNVGFWSRVLTQAEIKSIMWKQYADLSTDEKRSLVSWWNLDSASIANQYETNVTIDSVNSLGSELIKPTLALTDFSAYGNNTIEFDSSNDNALKVTYVDDDDGVLFRFRGDAGGANATLTSNPTSGNFYKFTFQAKSNITDTNTYFRTSSGTNYKVHLIDNTDWEEYVIYLKAASTAGDFMRIINLSSAEIVWMKDFSFKRLSGNHGTLT